MHMDMGLQPMHMHMGLQRGPTFHRIFRNGKLPLRLRPYRILATSPSSGLIEVVANAMSLDSVKRSVPHWSSLSDLFRRRYGGVHSRAFYRARRNFVQSAAAYSVVCYLLQVKDRHNGNILLHADGSLVRPHGSEWCHGVSQPRRPPTAL